MRIRTRTASGSKSYFTEHELSEITIEKLLDLRVGQRELKIASETNLYKNQESENLEKIQMITYALKWINFNLDAIEDELAKRLIKRSSIGESEESTPFDMPCNCSDRYTVETHGEGYAIYFGRCNHRHGANIGHLTNCTPLFSKLLENAMNLPEVEE